MQLHELRPIHKKKKRKRVGRGGKRGTYSGRGIKGQKARAGRRLKPAIRGFIKKYPKLRGYKFKPVRQKPVVINVGILEREFSAKGGFARGGKTEIKINPKILLERGLIRRIKGKISKVKILGKGKIKKPLIIKGCEISKAAKEKIETAGGQIK